MLLPFKGRAVSLESVNGRLRMGMQSWIVLFVGREFWFTCPHDTDYYAGFNFQVFDIIGIHILTPSMCTL